MIGRIKGKLLSKQPPELLVDVHGVGYEMEAPMSTFYQLPLVGEDVVLHTHMVVREDAQLLYAFASIGERKLFLSALWRALSPELPEYNRESFKEALVQAHRAGLLRLARADLVEAMDAAEVRASEVRYLTASFHFLILDAPAPERY